MFWLDRSWLISHAIFLNIVIGLVGELYLEKDYANFKRNR